MRLSTKGRYGLRAMIDLGLFSLEKKVSIKSIAERTTMSENYLEQLIALLKKAELVKSSRGAHGGYSLSREASDISLGQILRALEGDLNPVDCVTNNDEKVCSAAESCVTKNVWKKISDSINEVVDNISLQELIEEQLDIDHRQKEAHIG